MTEQPIISGGFSLQADCGRGQSAGAMLAGHSQVYYGVGTATYLNQRERHFGAAHGLQEAWTRRQAPCDSAVATLADAPPAAMPVAALSAVPALRAVPVISEALSGDLLFKFDRYGMADLLPGGKELLDQLAQRLKAEEATLRRVEVSGHTDRLGSDQYNLALSNRRAGTVSAYLAGLGLKLPIEAKGLGEAQPVQTCEGGDKATAALISCLQPNRRVVIEAFDR